MARRTGRTEREVAAERARQTQELAEQKAADDRKWDEEQKAQEEALIEEQRNRKFDELEREMDRFMYLKKIKWKWRTKMEGFELLRKQEKFATEELRGVLTFNEQLKSKAEYKKLGKEFEAARKNYERICKEWHVFTQRDGCTLTRLYLKATEKFGQSAKIMDKHVDEDYAEGDHRRTFNDEFPEYDGSGVAFGRRTTQELRIMAKERMRRKQTTTPRTYNQVADPRNTPGNAGAAN
eukprot:381938_1